MVISAILFVTVAMIIIYANQSWLNATKATDALQGSRTAKKLMEYQLRSAITVPAVFSASTNEPFVVSAEPFTISPAKDSIVFNVVDKASGRYKLDRFQLTDNEVHYDYWYADTQNGAVKYIIDNSTSITILQDVESMTVTPLPGVPATSVNVRIVQKKNLAQGDTNQFILSVTSFTVKTRNFK